MRILLAIHNAYTDQTSGAAQSMRIILEWLGEAGHEVRALATGRFDAMPPASLHTHLAEQGIEYRKTPPSKAFLKSIKRTANLGPGRPTLDFTLKGVPVTMIATQARPNTPAGQFEAAQFLFHVDALLNDFAPDIFLTYGGQPVVQTALKHAHDRGVRTVFSVRNYGYDDVRYYEYVDHVLTPSAYLSRYYRERIGIRSDAIHSPIDWPAVETPEEMRRFVTFVNPSRDKGVMLFARLADMLGSQRPDVPVLIVQSAHTAGQLNAIPELDFRKYPQIMVAPATPRPADFFALTRILLVPSTAHESFGRVVAESLINGIPPIVSDRGALPDTAGDGGIVVALPQWFTHESREMPSAAEVQPWLNAIYRLWDNPANYRALSARARSSAERRFSEAVMKENYRSYFETLLTRTSPFA